MEEKNIPSLERTLSAEEIREILINYSEMKPVPEYAFLINGKWGCGKTWLVKEILKIGETEENKKDTNPISQTVVYVSLFGKKCVKDISNDIFLQMHSLLENKYVQFFGKMILSSLRISFAPNENIKLDFEDVLNPIFSANFQEEKEIFFVFDDFERSSIQADELLGYFSQLLSTRKVRIVCIVNEDEIDSTRVNIFDKFKEKIFREEFIFAGARFEDVWETDAEYLPCDPDFKNALKQIWDSHKGYHQGNCRTLKSFLDVISNFSNKCKGKVDPTILKTLLQSLFERKVNALNPKENEAQQIYAPLLPILKAETWRKVSAGIINSQEIKDDVDEYLREKEEKSIWRTLWEYEEIKNDEELKEVEETAKEYLKNSDCLKLGELLHIVSALFEMIKKDFCYTSDSEISEISIQALNRLKETSPEQFSQLFSETYFEMWPDNAYGYEFRETETKGFRQILGYAKECWLEIERDKLKRRINIALKNDNLPLALSSIKECKNNFSRKQLQGSFDITLIPKDHFLHAIETDNFRKLVETIRSITQLTNKPLTSLEKEWFAGLIDELAQRKRVSTSKVFNYRASFVLAQLKTCVEQQVEGKTQ